MGETCSVSQGDTAASDENASRMKKANQFILDTAEEGIYGLDPQGFVTFTNQAAHQLTGWTLEDLKGVTQHSRLHHSHADGSHYPQQECPIYQAMRDGETYTREDEVFWRKDGTSFPVSYTSTPVLRDGLPYGAIVIFSDITDRLEQQAWQESKTRLISSIATRKPMRETILRFAEAFSLFIGSSVPAEKASEAAGF